MKRNQSINISEVVFQYLLITTTTIAEEEKIKKL